MANVFSEFLKRDRRSEAFLTGYDNKIDWIVRLNYKWWWWRIALRAVGMSNPKVVGQQYVCLNGI